MVVSSSKEDVITERRILLEKEIRRLFLAEIQGLDTHLKLMVAKKSKKRDCCRDCQDFIPQLLSFTQNIMKTRSVQLQMIEEYIQGILTESLRLTAEVNGLQRALSTTQTHILSLQQEKIENESALKGLQERERCRLSKVARSAGTQTSNFTSPSHSSHSSLVVQSPKSFLTNDPLRDYGSQQSPHQLKLENKEIPFQFHQSSYWCSPTFSTGSISGVNKEGAASSPNWEEDLQIEHDGDASPIQAKGRKTLEQEVAELFASVEKQAEAERRERIAHSPLETGGGSSGIGGMENKTRSVFPPLEIPEAESEDASPKAESGRDGSESKCSDTEGGMNGSEKGQEKKGEKGYEKSCEKEPEIALEKGHDNEPEKDAEKGQAKGAENEHANCSKKGQEKERKKAPEKGHENEEEEENSGGDCRNGSFDVKKIVERNVDIGDESETSASRETGDTETVSGEGARDNQARNIETRGVDSGGLGDRIEGAVGDDVGIKPDKASPCDGEDNQVDTHVDESKAGSLTVGKLFICEGGTQKHHKRAISSELEIGDTSGGKTQSSDGFISGNSALEASHSQVESRDRIDAKIIREAVTDPNKEKTESDHDPSANTNRNTKIESSTATLDEERIHETSCESSKNCPDNDVDSDSESDREVGSIIGGSDWCSGIGFGDSMLNGTSNVPEVDPAPGIEEAEPERIVSCSPIPCEEKCSSPVSSGSREKVEESQPFSSKGSREGSVSLLSSANQSLSSAHFDDGPMDANGQATFSEVGSDVNVSTTLVGFLFDRVNQSSASSTTDTGCGDSSKTLAVKNVGSTTGCVDSNAHSQLVSNCKTNDILQSDTSQPSSSQMSSVQPDSIPLDSTQTNALQLKASHSSSTQPQSAQSISTQPNPAQKKTTDPSTSKASTSKPNTSNPSTSKTDTSNSSPLQEPNSTRLASLLARASERKQRKEGFGAKSSSSNVITQEDCPGPSSIDSLAKIAASLDSLLVDPPPQPNSSSILPKSSPAKSSMIGTESSDVPCADVLADCVSESTLSMTSESSSKFSLGRSSVGDNKARTSDSRPVKLPGTESVSVTDTTTARPSQVKSTVSNSSQRNPSLHSKAANPARHSNPSTNSQHPKVSGTSSSITRSSLDATPVRVPSTNSSTTSRPTNTHTFPAESSTRSKDKPPKGQTTATDSSVLQALSRTSSLQSRGDDSMVPSRPITSQHASKPPTPRSSTSSRHSTDSTAPPVVKSTSSADKQAGNTKSVKSRSIWKRMLGKGSSKS